MTVQEYFHRVFRAGKNARFYLFDSNRHLEEALRVLFCVEYRACGLCTACELLASGAAQDVFSLRSEDGSRIKDANVEEAIRFTMTEPTLRYRVVVLYDAEKMTERAQNRLLKSLEQPREHVLYLMATKYPHQLLSTVLSRAIRVRLPLAGSVSSGSLSVELEDDDLRDDEVDRVARLLVSSNYEEKERFLSHYAKKEQQAELSNLMCAVVWVLRKWWHQAVLAEDMSKARRYEAVMLSIDKMLRHIDQNGMVALNIDIVSGGTLD